MSVKDISKLINKMWYDHDSNVKMIKKFFGSIYYTDDSKQSLLHILVDNKYDEEKCFLAICVLLKEGLSPNLEDDYKYNFIQTALYTGYSEKFILGIIAQAIYYRLDVNHVDSDGDTIMHTAIYADDYVENLDKIYEVLCASGFDSSIVNNDEDSIIDAIYDSDEKYKRSTMESFEELVKTKSGFHWTPKHKWEKTQTIFENKINIIEEELNKFEEFGQILNKKKYISDPAIGRGKEFKNIMITLAQEKKNPIIVGESGVGKTALVEQLAYKIQMQDIPNFLKGKVILEINPNELVSGCKYSGQFEEKVKKLIKLCAKHKDNLILFIDEIHSIYGVGTTEHNKNDFAAMLKHAIDREGIKVIGTTTDYEYNEFFSNDALKRRFEKIVVKEPEEDTLYIIINKIFEDYSKKNEIYFKDEIIKEKIINILLKSTKNNHRVYNDKVNNPDLIISIIDRAFALAKIYDSNYIETSYFIEVFECCDRIYETAKQKAISDLRLLEQHNNIESKPVVKVLRPDFTQFKK